MIMASAVGHHSVFALKITFLKSVRKGEVRTRFARASAGIMKVLRSAFSQGNNILSDLSQRNQTRLIF